MMRHLRGVRLAGLLVLVITLLLSIVSTSGQAEAASRGAANPQILVGSFKENYKKSWTFKSAPLRRCVYITASGNITYTLSKNNGGRGQTIDYWTNQRLNNATLSISIVAMGRNGSCLRSAKVDGADLQQDWTGYGCSFNPSLGFSYPWGVSFSLWPSCGDRHQVGYESDPPGSYSSYHQYNSGSRASFGDYSQPFYVTSNPCYGVYPTIIIYLRGSSDSYGAGDSRAQAVCLPWHGSRA
jgi:hypothetical protein